MLRPLHRGQAEHQIREDRTTDPTRHLGHDIRTELSTTDQDSVLIDVETGAATGFTGSSAAFFALVLNHTHQGTFGDPYYGGNANFIGWDLIGYPGIRTMVTAADQKSLEGHTLKANHKSAYDYESFTKASASLSRRSSGEKGA